jgi:transposase
MKALRQIIELHAVTRLSDRRISAATGVSRPTVSGYIEAYKRSGMGYEEFCGLSDTEAVRRLQDDGKEKDNKRFDDAVAFFPYMLNELPRVGVTRDILWNEYKGKHEDGYEYSQFCHLFRNWCSAETEVRLTMEHKAGDRMYVDFSGVRRSYRQNGIEREAELFVAILGASQYTYVEAVPSQKKRDFISANLHALYFFGGVPAAIVPDCLKSGVSKADKYESEINPEYAEFARQHGTVIFPARPHSPRDKALVESAVNIMYTRILAPLRDREFDSLEELNEAISELLEVHNAKPFQKIPGTRAQLFESTDRPALRPLPERRYEYADIKPDVAVGINYHVEIREDRHFYSVPYQYAGKRVCVVYTDRTVEIYHDNQRIAFHKRVEAPGYSTLPEHRPAHHRFHLEWTPERIIRWAGDISIHTRSLVEAVLDRAEYPDQAFRGCIGIINFSKKYSVQRLDTACRIAISEKTYSYRAVKRILEKGRDLLVIEDEKQQHPLPFHENIRGQAAYQ